MALIQVFIKQIEDILLLKWESLNELQGFGEHVEWLVVCFCAKSYRESTNFVNNTSVLEDCLCTNEHTVNLGDTKSYGAVQNSFAWDLLLLTELLDILASKVWMALSCNHTNLDSFICSIQ